MSLKQIGQQLLQSVQGLEQEKLAQWTGMALMIVIAFSAASTTWNLVSVFQPPVYTPSPVAGSTPSIISPQTPKQSSLSQLHLFGSAQSASQGPIDAPETRLNLVLNGVIASDSKLIARAFIGTAGGNEKSYRLDEAVPGGAVLKEIYDDRVILQRNGRFETLRMPKKVSSIVMQADEPVSTEPASGKDLIRPDVTREEVLQYKNKLLTSPNDLAGAIRQRPVRRNGKIIGYRLFPGSEKDAFNRLGLKPGDIVTGVNGMPLSDPSSAMALYGQLPTMQELNIEVERQGQTMSLTLPWQ
ncbi:MAG: type II secretion system protein GspC [Gammaproteobacteria bacterium]|nr:type II secretion system protein GspC [Gammaproteobacteria bacterium]